MLCFEFFILFLLNLKMMINWQSAFDLRMIRIGILFTLISVELQPGSVSCMLTRERV